MITTREGIADFVNSLSVGDCFSLDSVFDCKDNPEFAHIFFSELRKRGLRTHDSTADVLRIKAINSKIL